MRILALESSAVAASAALLTDGELTASVFQSAGLTHSTTLMPMCADMLAGCGLSVADVDLIAVARGPGSFTGIRIGVAAARGLAWGAEKPCCGVSTLEAMAMPLAFEEGAVICCVMDARRSQVYNALFSVEGGALVRLAPDSALSLEELGQELKKTEKRVIIVGDGAKLCYNTLKSAADKLELAPAPYLMQSAYGVALAAADEAKRFEPVPNYLRKSQAEREREARLASQNS